MAAAAGTAATAASAANRPVAIQVPERQALSSYTSALPGLAGS
ncbi:hypothetical protein ACFQBY_21675 [Promicromonospora citrea]|nr:hypothetical protein [Promicromonospora citrea]